MIQLSTILKLIWNREKTEPGTATPQSLGHGFRARLLGLKPIEAPNLEAGNPETQSARRVNIPAGLDLLCLGCELDKQEPVVVIRAIIQIPIALSWPSSFAM